MHQCLILAWNSFLEARHNKILHIAGLFCALLIIFSLFMGEVSLYQNEKVVKDVGMACISLLGIFVAVFMGVSTLTRELEGRTIYSIMAKPMERYQILVGKYLGMVFVLFVVVVMMTIYLYTVTAFMEATVDIHLLPAIGLIFVELAVVAAFAIFFSSFSTPFLSGFFTVGVVIVGRVAKELGEFGARSKNIIFKFFAEGVQTVFDLDSFNLRTRAVHKFPIYYQDFWLPVLYGILIVAILMTISIMTFQKRDFK